MHKVQEFIAKNAKENGWSESYTVSVLCRFIEEISHFKRIRPTELCSQLVHFVSATRFRVNVIIYTVDNKKSNGFEIHFYQDGKWLESYSAGGNPHDSCAPGVSTIPVIRKWAIQTAKDMLKDRQGFKGKIDQINVELIPYDFFGVGD